MHSVRAAGTLCISLYIYVWLIRQITSYQCVSIQSYIEN